MKSTKRIYVYFDDGLNSLQFLGDLDAFSDTKEEKIIQMAQETYLSLYTELYKFNISARLENYNKVIFTNEIDILPPKTYHVSPKKEEERKFEFEKPKKFEHPIIAYD